MRARIGRWLRAWADRIDYHGAYRITGYTFTMRPGEGLQVQWGGDGCPIVYSGEDNYQRAHAGPRDAVPSFTEQHANPSLIETAAKGARAPRRTKGGYMAADVPVSAMGPLPDVLTRPGLGQKSPRGTVRPPVITTQQVAPPPPSVHHHCGHCDCR